MFINITQKLSKKLTMSTNCTSEIYFLVTERFSIVKKLSINLKMMQIQVSKLTLFFEIAKH